MNNNQTQQFRQQPQAPQGPTKTCKHCKSIIPKGAKVCPVCRKKQGGIGKWIIVAVVVIIIIAALGSGGSDSDTPTSSNTHADNSDISDAKTSNDANVANTETNSGTNEDNDGEIQFSVGETWKNNYMKVTYMECGEYTDYNEYFAPQDGNRIVYASFEFENVSDSDQVAMYTDFHCYADGYSCDGYYYSDDSIFSETLSSGRKCNGTVYFEVPEDATEIEFEYDVNFWTSENIVFTYSE